MSAEMEGTPEQRSDALLDKTAVLVVHGIGEQNPYETLDQFSRGLLDHFEAVTGQRPRIEPMMIHPEDWNEVAIRLDLNGHRTLRGSSILDLYEYYWAPHTEGKITYLQTLGWLRRTALTPLRYLGYGVELFSRPGRPGGLFLAFTREILRFIFLLLPLVLLTFVLVYFFNRATFTEVKVVFNLFRKAQMLDRFLLILLLFSTLLTFNCLRALWVLREESRVGQESSLRALSQKSLQRWTLLVAATWVASMLVTFVVGVHLGVDLKPAGKEISRLHLVSTLLLCGIAFWLKSILVEYVGDIAVYANADAKAASYQARSAILKEVRESVLRPVHSPQGYTRIVLAGHSLGSVITYDLLNRLLDEVRAPYATGPLGVLQGKLDSKDLERVQGLVTFGSPLDKIYYFYRTQVPAQQAIRAQILSFMHGFRRAPSARSYGHYQFPRYTIPDPSPDFKWINIWAAADPVSGPLDFYEVGGHGNPNLSANQFRRAYPWYRWGVAHLLYWSDPGFYKIVAQEIL